MTPRLTACAAISLAAVLAAPCAGAAEAVIIVQRSPVAGFRHSGGAEVLRDLKPGDRLELAREPANPYDANAVRVEWRGVKLGYVPRRDNAAVARQMDRGVALEARLAGARE
ncbi:MAG: HIRAN domain-containing protein, partial [Burkholderiales bacterium]